MLGFLAVIGTFAVLFGVWIWGYAYAYSSIMKKYDEKNGVGSFRKLCNEIGLPS